VARVTTSTNTKSGFGDGRVRRNLIMVCNVEVAIIIAMTTVRVCGVWPRGGSREFVVGHLAVAFDESISLSERVIAVCSAEW
jgi:hypothetical protein